MALPSPRDAFTHAPRPPSRPPPRRQEWAWQHPTSSKAVRDHVRGVPSRGAPAKLQVLIAMLQIEPWSQLPLRLHFASGEVAATAAAFPRQPPPHIATRTSVGPIADLWIYADAARLLAVARAAKSEERAAARALKLAAKTRQRGAKGDGGGCGRGGVGGSSIYDSASVSAGSSWEGASASEEVEGGGGGDAPAPRRSSLHRFRVRRRSEVATAVAEEVEVINISSDSEEAATTAGAPAAGAESLMEVLEVVDDEEGNDGDIGDEGLDEAWPLSQGSEVEEAAAADLLALPLAERLRRRLEAEAGGGGGGGGSGGGPAARPAPAGAASAPCACCGAPVSVSEHASAWLRCEGCGSVAHATCLADYFLQVQSGGVSDALLSRVAPTPAPVPCPARGCAQQLTWPLLVEEALRRGLVTLSPAQLRRALDLEPSAAPRPPKKRRIKKK